MAGETSPPVNERLIARSIGYPLPRFEPGEVVLLGLFSFLTVVLVRFQDFEGNLIVVVVMVAAIVVGHVH